MFVRCGRRFAINVQHVVYVEEMNLTEIGPHPLRVGLATGIILDLEEEEAVPLRASLNLVAPLSTKRKVTPARSGAIKKRDD